MWSRQVNYEWDATTGKIVRDGWLSIYKKVQADGGAIEGGGLYAILDRKEKTSENDEEVLKVPIRVFVTGDLAFYFTVVGKEGVDKDHYFWCRCKKGIWQSCGHPPGIQWNLAEIKRIASTLGGTRTSEESVKSYPLLDCIEICRYIFPVLHVTLGVVNRLLKWILDYADLVVEKTPTALTKARAKQMETEHVHLEKKKEITDWGFLNGGTLANMLIAQGHLREQLEVEGEILLEDRTEAIANEISLKKEIMSFKKELTVLKKAQEDLSALNTVAKEELKGLEKELGKYSKPVRRELERILEREFDIKRPNYHGGDICGNEARRLMTTAMKVMLRFNQYLQVELVENGGTDRARRETKKQCEVVGNALLNFDGFLSLLRTPHKDLTPAIFAQARQYSKKALELWRILEIKVTPKAHGVEDHACDQLEFLMGLADFCEDWVERLHQLGLKNNRRTRTISNKDRKYQLYTKWEQISGNRQVQSIKRSIHSKRKRELTTTRGSDTAYKIQSEKKYHRKEALEVDTSQWMGENALLGPSIILRQDAAERSTLLAEQ